MRILVLSWEYPPIVEGGLARHVDKLTQQLAAAGHQVHVLTRGSAETASAAKQTEDGVFVHRTSEPRRPNEMGEFLVWINEMNNDMLDLAEQICDEFEFDMVHAHDWLVASAADRLARRLAKPLIATIHATEFGRHQGWVDKHPQSHIHGIETFLTRRADHVIACSHYMRDHIIDVFKVPEDRVSVIPNGIDTRDLQPREDLHQLRKMFAAENEQLVLLVGRLVYEKGFQNALEALAGPNGVINQVGKVRFVVAGSGTHEDELHKLATELGLDDHGQFLGWIDDGYLHSLYRIADLCVVPSIFEPFGLVALEAMASGCACIVADSGGLREVVPDDTVGLRFPAGDPVALAEAMKRLLVDRELRDQLVEKSKTHISKFDWAEIARETVEIYDDLSAIKG